MMLRDVHWGIVHYWPGRFHLYGILCTVRRVSLGISQKSPGVETRHVLSQRQRVGKTRKEEIEKAAIIFYILFYAMPPSGRQMRQFHTYNKSLVLYYACIFAFRAYITSLVLYYTLIIYQRARKRKETRLVTTASVVEVGKEEIEKSAFIFIYILLHAMSPSEKQMKQYHAYNNSSFELYVCCCIMRAWRWNETHLVTTETCG